MLNALFLALAAFAVSAQSVLQKSYNVKVGRGGAFVFSATSVLFAAVFFLAFGGGHLRFPMEVLPYALGFALSYGTAVIAGLLAIKLGSLSLTSLIISYSLIIPTLYGICFLEEEAGLLFGAGLSLLFVSLFLMNARKGGSKIKLAWVVAVFFAFLGNGICSTVQTVQQKTFRGEYGGEMMAFALLTVAAVTSVAAVAFERKDILPSLRHGGTRAAACGLFNGACNLLVMLLAVRMEVAVMFPVISASGILFTGAVSRFLYKERLSRRQYVALILGTIAVVLMNL